MRFKKIKGERDTKAECNYFGNSRFFGRRRFPRQILHFFARMGFSAPHRLHTDFSNR